MSGRRGRKKAAPAKQQQLGADADDEILNPESATKAVLPAAPASPLVTLATHAISPVVAAARAVTSVAAAVLPTIPETAAAVATQALDVDRDRSLSPTPRSPTSPTGMHNPFTAPATLKQTRSRTVGFGVATAAAQQEQHNHLTNDLCHQDSLQRDQDKPADSVDYDGSSRPLLQTVATLIRRYGSYIVCIIALIALTGLVLQQGSALQAQQASISQQHQHITAQAAALEALQQDLQQAKQQLQQLPDQQQLEAVAATCSAGLDDLNSTQTLLNSSMSHLETVAQQLAANITIVDRASQVGVQAWEVLSAATAGGEASSAHGSTPEAPVADAFSNTAGSKPVTLTPHALLLQRYGEQQSLQQQLQETQQVIKTLPSKVRQEVEQQLDAKLLPLDVALADCGARVVFHTAINASRFLQDAVAGTGQLSPAEFEFLSSNLAAWAHSPAEAVTAQSATTAEISPAAQEPGSSILHKGQSLIASQVRQAFQLPDPRAAQAAAAASRKARLQQMQQHMLQQLMSPERISRLLLSPAGQAVGRCLPLVVQDGAPAVLEIALPQMMEVHSVTLHYPASPTQTQDSPRLASWFNRAPAAVTVALVNSSSCTTVPPHVSSSTSNSVLCSAAGTYSNISKGNEDTSIDADSKPQVANATREAAAASAANIPAASILADAARSGPRPDGLLVQGVTSVRRSVQLTAEAFSEANGRAVVRMQQTKVGETREDAAGDASAGTGAEAGGGQRVERGVFADRLVIELSTRIGGGLEGVCLQRVSVQGTPTDIGAFC